MAFSPRNLALVVFAFTSILAPAYADSYIVDKETDGTLMIVIAFFLALAFVLFLLSIYFVWRYYRCGSDEYGTKTRNNLYHVTVEERNTVNPGQHANPFQKHGKYSQKPGIYENIYLPHYETVIGPNQNEVYEATECIPDDVVSKRGAEKHGANTLHHVSVKDRNSVNPDEHVNPFQKHGKYSQKPSMYENIYLPHYETVIDPNQNEVYEATESKSNMETRRFDNMYLPGMSSSTFHPHVQADSGDYELVYDPSESSDKEKRDYPVLEEVQRDTQISKKDDTITMTNVVTREVVHSTSRPSNENYAYDSFDEIEVSFSE